MHKLTPCSEYDSSTGKCKSGHVQIHPLCRGVDHGSTCKNCGHHSDLPLCMRDDAPPHLVREDGYPLLWPIKAARADAHRAKGGVV